MKNLISVGGQQQGVYGIPYCPPKDFLCEKMRQLIDLGAYTWFIQSTLVQKLFSCFHRDIPLSLLLYYALF